MDIHAHTCGYDKTIRVEAVEHFEACVCDTWIDDGGWHILLITFDLEHSGAMKGQQGFVIKIAIYIPAANVAYSWLVKPPLALES